MAFDPREMVFTDADGASVRVADWLGRGESVLLVFLRHLG